MQNHLIRALELGRPDRVRAGEGRSQVPIEIEAYEAEEFATAIAGLDVEYVRTGGGDDPCRMTVAESDDAQLSVGSMGFSAASRSEIPSDVGVFALITAAPFGGRYCGVDLSVGQLFFYAPATSFVGVETIGLEASILTLPTASVHRVAEGLVDTAMFRSVEPLAPSPAVDQFASLIMRASTRPEYMVDSHRGETILEAAAAVLAANSASVRFPVGRRLDSRTIVARSIDYADSTPTHQPTVGELCRVAGTSKNRLRQAFVDVLEMPPTQYFQYRLLSRFRKELLLAEPTESSVTHIAGSLGVTEFGRTSGRYKEAFGELPRETMRRRTRHNFGSASHSGGLPRP